MYRKIYLLLSAALFVSPNVSSMAMDNNQEAVVIVGAGMAGLTAGYTLSKDGIPVTIYEGRDRIGGRTHTHYFDSSKQTFYEEGGTFIDSDHNSAIELAGKLNIELIKRGYGSRKITTIYGGRLQPISTLNAELKSIKLQLTQQWDQVQSNSEAQMEWNGLEWCARSIEPHLANLSPFGKSFVQTYLEDETGISLSKGSVYALNWMTNDIGEYSQLLTYKNNPFFPNLIIDCLAYNYTVKGGMSTFVHGLADSLPSSSPIKLHHKLTRVQKEEDYVLTFETQDGEKHVTAKNVIITLPFSTLREVIIDDSVGLSKFQRKAIQTLPYGTNSKIGVPVFGQKRIYDDMLYYLNLDDKFIGWPGENAVTLMVNAANGKVLDEESAHQLFNKQRDYILDSYPYIESFGPPSVKNWAQDPFARGSYSTQTSTHDLILGNYHEDTEKYPGMRNYAEPIGGVFFAGEHTRADGTAGHIEGAIRSGLQVAALLQGKLN
ncbi:MAG: FAD-dependent oxidoreductase [Candidatus Paracaedibacteraceae bacterium]|nr:FAD-dependent oxidoreductase [Candidatus Paracaedibacteraceae bacterium]